jgi:hypothetical protein
VPIRDIPAHLLATHELMITGFERPGLWSEQHMFNRPDVEGVALVTSNPPQSIDDMLGWTVIRRSAGGPRIGPLYADTPAMAEVVLAKAMQEANAVYVKHVPLPETLETVGSKDAFVAASEEDVVAGAQLVAEVWVGNVDAVAVFERLGWRDADVYYHRMWVDGQATPEFSEGGAAQRSVFAVFDAAVG